MRFRTPKAGNIIVHAPPDTYIPGLGRTAASKSMEGKVIARHWRGLARPSEAQKYVQHLRTATFPALRNIPGFVDASILSRQIGDGVEFLIVTRWQSLQAIAAFAGADPEVAVVPDEVVAMMIDYDQRAKHFEVIA
jgi:heme-degrading monooxygenase HmoA